MQWRTTRPGNSYELYERTSAVGFDREEEIRSRLLIASKPCAPFGTIGQEGLHLEEVGDGKAQYLSHYLAARAGCFADRAKYAKGQESGRHS